MNIIEIKAMRGPNVWSIRRHKLIVMKLDLQQLEQQPTDKIEGFAPRFEAFFPSIYSHRCSEGIDGGFFNRVREGTWMGHVVEHIALEIQTMAGMNVGFGRTRSVGDHAPGVYHVVFAYMEEKAGLHAAKAAVAIVEALIASTEKEYDLEADLQAMREQGRRQDDDHQQHQHRVDHRRDIDFCHRCHMPAFIKSTEAHQFLIPQPARRLLDKHAGRMQKHPARPA